jgi:hypothetical protein
MPDDTVQAARDVQVALARSLGPRDRLRRAAEMSEGSRRISIDAERRRHPELSEAAARAIVLQRIWGPELAQRVEIAATRRG